MARIRTIKPELFRHQGLFKLEQKTGFPIRVAWMGLFTVADREGRFRWDPAVIKLDVLPFDEVDMELVMNALWEGGFIEKYQVGGKEYGRIPSFLDHQVIPHREAKSKLPPPDDGRHVVPPGNCSAMPGNYRGEQEGKGKGREQEKEQEGKGYMHGADAPPARVEATRRSRILGPLPEFGSNLISQTRLSDVSQEVQEAWLAAYPSADWISQEIKKAHVWLVANPKKAPKNFGKFMTNWLSRSFEDYRKGIPSSRQTASQKNADALRELHDRVLKGEV